MFAWYRSAESFLIPAQLVLVMTGMGATLTVRDFAGVVRNPGSLALALGLHWLLVPLAAALLASALGLGEGWTLGLLLVATAPPAAFSNLFTFLGRGNLALSVSATAVATIGSTLTVPLVLGWLAAAHLPAEFTFPMRRIVIEIVLYLLTPLLIGMAIRHNVGEPRARMVSRLCVLGGLVLVVVLTTGALGSGRIKVGEYGWGPPLRIVLFGTVLALVTPQLTRILGRYDDDTLALSVQVAMRNMGVALLMARFFFPGKPEQAHVLYTCLFYAGAAMWFAVPAVLLHRLGWPVVLGRRRHPRP